MTIIPADTTADVAATLNRQDTVAVPVNLLESLGILALLPITILLQAWCIWLLWGWFALPPWGALTFAQAVGLGCLVSFLRVRAPVKGMPAPGLKETLHYCGIMLFCLGIGGILRLCGAGS